MLKGSRCLVRPPGILCEGDLPVWREGPKEDQELWPFSKEGFTAPGGSTLNSILWEKEKQGKEGGVDTAAYLPAVLETEPRVC